MNPSTIATSATRAASSLRWLPGFALAFMLASCNSSQSPGFRFIHLNLAQFKHRLDSAVRYADTSTQYYEVEGYYVNESIPMMVSDLDLLRENSLLPDSSFLVLSGLGVDSVVSREQSKSERTEAFVRGLRQSETSYEGAYVSTRLSLKLTRRMLAGLFQRLFRDYFTDTTLVKLNVLEKPQITRRANEFFSSLNKKIRLLESKDLPQNENSIAAPPDTNKYALLYSGGYDTAQNKLRYWNDLVFMYNTLVAKCAFSPNNIIVVYANGAPPAKATTRIPTNYPATNDALKTAMAQLKTRLTVKSTFFTFITNHGGSYDTVINKIKGGRSDENKDEETGDVKKWDEEIYFYNQQPADLWDDTLTVLFAGLKYDKFIALIEPCYGGGLIHDLCGPNRILLSASTQYESSYGDYSVSHTDFDTFSYYFTCALNGKTVDNRDVNADSDGDGRVSMLEAFQFAKGMDKEKEHPQLEDSGDGISAPSPDPTSVDGKLAAHTFLN